MKLELTGQDKRLFDRALAALNDGEISDAVELFDELQIANPQCWQGLFYHAFCSASETTAKYTKIRIIDMSMWLGELDTRSKALSKRAFKTVERIWSSEGSEEARVAAIKEVIDRIGRWMAEFDEIFRKLSWKFRNNKSWPKTDGQLGDAVSLVGYELGDALAEHVDGSQGAFFKEQTILVWQMSCKLNHAHLYNRSVRKTYVEKVKKLAPDISVGGEISDFFTKLFLKVVGLLVVGFIVYSKVKSMLN